MSSPSRRVLLVRSADRICALAMEHVAETMRPLRTEPLSGTAPFVTGVAIVRGEPVPVVDLAAFLVEGSSERATRWVVVRCGTRRAALAVGAVLGVDDVVAAEPAPLLGPACRGAVAALSALDRELLVVLETARVVPEEAWRALSVAERRT